MAGETPLKKFISICFVLYILVLSFLAGVSGQRLGKYPVCQAEAKNVTRIPEISGKSSHHNDNSQAKR
jgi:hypothetical protein